MFRITMLPAEDGDCFLVETGTPENIHRILIDGGRLSTARTHLHALMDTVRQSHRPRIDLVVVTHVDADHIEGLLDLMTAENVPEIGEIWFNEFRHIRLAQRKLPPPVPKQSAEP